MKIFTNVRESFVLSLLSLYFCLTAITTLLCGEFVFRHTLFLLAVSLIFNIGLRFFKKRSYCFANLSFLFFIGVLFLLHYLTPDVIRVWEVDMFIAYAFCLGNLLALISALIPLSVKTKQVLITLPTFFLLLPLPIFAGYFLVTGNWINPDAIIALKQTNFSEAIDYLRDFVGMGAVVLFPVMLLFTFALSRLLRDVSFAPLSRSRLLILGSLFFVLTGVLLFRTRENFATYSFFEAQIYERELEKFRNNRARYKATTKPVGLSKTGENGLYLLVIGESATRSRMGAYGFERDTTPWLTKMRSAENFILFPRAYSCHVNTLQSLAYALTSKNQYNEIDFAASSSLVDVVHAAGGKVAWLSNHVRLEASPVSAMAYDADEQIWLNTHIGNTPQSTSFDGALLPYFEKLKFYDKELIVIHLMGSHNSYQSRYPKDFEKFPRGDYRTGYYDNSLFYTDFVLKQLYEAASKRPDFKAMIYFSDHGEGASYGQGHDASLFLWDIARIPLFIVVSDSFKNEQLDKFNRLKKNSNSVFTNDLIYNLVLSIMNIETKDGYERENDVASEDYNSNENRFTTYYGQKRITEDTGDKD